MGSFLPPHPLLRLPHPLPTAPHPRQTPLRHGRSRLKRTPSPTRSLDQFIYAIIPNTDHPACLFRQPFLPLSVTSVTVAWTASPATVRRNPLVLCALHSEPRPRSKSTTNTISAITSSR